MSNEITIDFYGDPTTIQIPEGYSVVIEGTIEDSDLTISLPDNKWIELTAEDKKSLQNADLGENLDDFFCVIRKNK